MHVEWMSAESKELLLINFVPIELFKIKLKQVHCDVCFTKSVIRLHSNMTSITPLHV